MRRLGAVALVLAVASACDDYLYQQSGGEGTIPEGATWTAVKAFFEIECNQCHAVTPPVLPGDVEADVRSGAGELVVAGSSQDSKLWRVITGELAADDFDVMPLGTGPLPSSETAFIGEWIDAGASLDEGTGTTPPTTSDPPDYAGDWDGVQQLMSDLCAACHGDGGIAVPVLPGDVEDDLLDNARAYVAPYSLEDSLVWRVASGNPVGDDEGPMPPGEGLDAGPLAAIEAWILDGAQTGVPLGYAPTWEGVQAMMGDHCVPCHEKGGASGIVFPNDVAEDVAKGTGDYVVAGSPADSRLWRVLSGTVDPKLDSVPFMPADADSPLGTPEIAHVEQWIETGAEP